jgi:hypothetical protein
MVRTDDRDGHHRIEKSIDHRNRRGNAPIELSECNRPDVIDHGNRVWLLLRGLSHDTGECPGATGHLQTTPSGALPA